MLANPSSTSAADMQRRDAVQARVNEYNAVLAAACAATPKCWWDGGAVANYVVHPGRHLHPGLLPPLDRGAGDAREHHLGRIAVGALTGA